MNTISRLFTVLALATPCFLLAQFSDALTIDASFDADLLHPVDLDSDGDIDILAGSHSGGHWWYENDGDGQFSTAITLPGIASVYHLDVADLDGDGDQDILFLSQESLYWQRNEGGGSFSEEMLFNDPMVESAVGVEAQDMNGDGWLDIVYTGSYTGTKVAINPGDGNFPSSTPTILDLGGFYHNFFALGDVDLDGDPDLLMNNAEGFFADVWLNDGTGAIDGSLLVANNEANGPLVRPLTGFLFDVDEDGYLDVIYQSASYEGAFWHQNLTGNGFGWGSLLLPEHTLVTDAADVDADGRLDLLTHSNGVVVWHRNLGPQQFAADTITSGVQISGQKGSYTFQDFDGDDSPDLAVIRTDGSLVWFRNESNHPAVLVNCFWDANENGVQDAGEAGIHQLPVHLDSPSETYFTDQQGHIRLFFGEGDYTLEIPATACWSTTGGTITYDLNWDGLITDTIQLGFSWMLGGEAEQSVGLASAATRCNTEVPFQLSLNNSGCQWGAGVVALVVDDQTLWDNVNPAPDLITDQTLWWTFENLLPGQREQWLLDLQMPNADAEGDTLAYHWYVYTADCVDDPDLNGPTSDLSQGLTLCQTGLYQPILRCSYDPNDKQVAPFRDLLHNFTRLDETLEYTLRFQNVGNDTAFTVRVRDRLSPYLDWNSLRVLGASHPYHVQLNNQSGELTFTFDSIRLPDSTTNQRASHGFLQYAIQARPTIPDHTLITNQARIYFDLASPVSTNVVASEMVAAIPLAQAPQAAFDFGLDQLSIWLNDLSAHYPSAWYWTFGDGSSSTQPQPSHDYTLAGDYEICLSVANEIGADTICQTLTIAGNQPAAVTFGDAQFIHSLATQATSCFPLDLNGDGYIDVAAIQNGAVVTYLNDGDGQFAAPLMVDEAVNNGVYIHAADLNGDAFGDLLIARQDGTVQWYSNDGNGIFSGPENVAAMDSGLRRVHPADLDQDGDVDILIGWQDDLVWAENDGDGQFSNLHSITDPIWPVWGLDVADLDEDGDADILLSTSREVAWLEQIGNQVFLPKPLLSGVLEPYAGVVAADLTIDAIPDVLYIYNDFSLPTDVGSVRWRENTGTGAFAPVQSLSSTNLVEAMAVGDLDHDGDIDVISGVDYDELNWFRNQAGQSFSGLQPIATGSGHSQVFTADMDGDQDLDILAIRKTPDASIVWYENQLPVQLPIAHFTYLTMTDVVVFTDQSLFLPTYWSWGFGDGQTSELPNPNHTYVTTGTYDVCLTAGNSAGETTVCQPLRVVLLPQAAFSFTSDGPTIYFSDESTNAPDSWFWDFDDGQTSDLPDPSHTYASTGTYEVCLLVANSAGESILCQSVPIIVDDVREVAQRESYIIVPNPTRGQVTIFLEQELAVGSGYQLFDLSGRAMSAPTALSGQQLALDVSAFPAGGYIFQIIDHRQKVIHGIFFRAP